MRGLWIVAGIVAAFGCRPVARPTTLPPLPVDAYAHYLRGRAAFFEGDYQLAVPELERAMAAAPDQAGIAIAHAQAIARLGERVDAQAAIDRVVARWPNSPEAWLAAGELRSRNRDGAATTAYAKAVALDPELEAAYVGLAAAQTHDGHDADAERTYRTMVARLPRAALGHWRLAQMALARGDDTSAEPRLQRVLELTPNDLEPRRALASLYARSERVTDAIAQARSAFDRSGADLAVGEDLVWLLLEAGDRNGALDVLALYDDSATVDDLRRVAELLIGLGAFDRAATAIARASQHADVAILDAQLALASGDLERAIIRADSVDHSGDSGADAQALAAWAELGFGGTRDAAVADRLAQALARAPNHLSLVEVEAERRRRHGDTAGGRALFAAAATANPHRAAIALAWANFERRAGESARAVRLAEKVLAATPNDTNVAAMVGALLIDGPAADPTRAQQLLRFARRRTPGDANIADGWGWLRRSIGDLRGAARALDRAVLIAPTDPVIVDHAATIAFERGDVARAGRLWSSLVGQVMAPELAAQVRDGIARSHAEPCYAGAVMRMPWLTRVALGSVFAAAACQATPSKGDCEKLLAHLIDIEVASGGGNLPKDPKGVDQLKPEIDKQKKAITDYAIGQKFIATCSEKTPKKVVMCGLAAKNADDVGKCDQ